MAFIGLDVGTTGCKATVINKLGEVVSYAYQNYELIIPAQGMAELNADVVWQSVREVLQQAVLNSQSKIEAITVASFGETFVCLDENSKVLNNSILYSDIRGTQEIADVLAAVEKNELFNITGMPINAMYTLNKLLWVKKYTKDYQRAKYIMLFGDFIIYKLSGQRKIDYSLASRTSLFDYKKKEWAHELMDLFDIDEDKFSSTIAPGKIIGNISKSVALELGLTEHVMLVAGGHDQVCAALGAGVLNNGDCVDGIGTSECITTMVSNVENTEYMLNNNFCIEPYVIDNRYVSLGFYPAAGATLNWYRNTIERERNREYKRTGKNIYMAMESECPEEPTSLFLLPYLAGTGTPYMDTTAAGAVLGLKLGTSRGELYKACLEGLCFEIMLNAELLSNIGTNISNLVCVGGVSQSDLLMQIKADIMGIPVTRLKVKESGTMGLAMLCFVACKEYRDYEEASKVMVKPEKTFEPDRKKHCMYMEKYGVYKNIYKRLKKVYAG